MILKGRCFSALFLGVAQTPVTAPGHVEPGDPLQGHSAKCLKGYSSRRSIHVGGHSGIACDLHLTNTPQRTSSQAPRAATCRTLGTTLKRSQMSLLRCFLQITQYREKKIGFGYIFSPENVSEPYFFNTWLSFRSNGHIKKRTKEYD